MLRTLLLAGAAVIGALGMACADEMAAPRMVPAAIDWDAAKADIAQPAEAGDTPGADTLLQALNASNDARFSGIAASAVPVLLPTGAPPSETAAAFPGADLTGFRPSMFLAGPSGYDAAFLIRPGAVSGLAGVSFSEEATVLISGSAVLYTLDASVSEPAAPAKDLQAQFPGIRRLWRESHLRYTFVRYGVPYAVSTQCIEGPSRGRRMSCRDADKVLSRFVGALRVAGGTPPGAPFVPAETIARPADESPDFTYLPPGRLLPNTGVRGNDGRSDPTVYARIRFPLAQAPAFANSQSFMHWGDCDHTGRSARSNAKGAPYHCKVNDKPLVFDESAAENRAYPWRDNFCEHRFFFVGQCPGGLGHQGQDIRPVTCKLRNEGADRCQPYQDDVVAARDGTLMRSPRQESLYLFVNAPGEHVRFRYLHMSPAMMDADGLLSGRRVREGEVIGKVGNYDDYPSGTTYHLHFEVQVPTADGWVYVNPYMTLVAAYERLLGARGREIAEPVVAQADTARPLGAATTVATIDAVTHDISAAAGGPDRVGKDAAGERKAGERVRTAALSCEKATARRSRARGCGGRHAHRKRARHVR